MTAFFLHAAAWLLLALAVNGRVRARRVFQWKLGVLATEFGLFLAPVAASLAALSWFFLAGTKGSVASGVAWLAAGLFICPEFLSLRLALGIPNKLRSAFGPLAVPAPLPPRAGPTSDDAPWRRILAPLFCFPRTTCKPVRTLEFQYPGAGGVPRRIIFYPAIRPNAPCLLVMHTGGWESGEPEEFAGFHAALARLGYAVASVEYGLTPEFAWPTQRDDVRSALHWLKENALRLGIDANNLVLFGRSAGGQVALCVAYDRPDASVRGVAAFYAPTDMVFSWRGSYPGDMLNSAKILSNYLGGRPEECPQAHAEASPTRHACPKNPMPTLLLHGARDEIVWCLQIRRLARILNRNASPHFALLLPWGRHGFDYRLRGPGGRIAWKSLTGFLAAVTAPIPSQDKK